MLLLQASATLGYPAFELRREGENVWQMALHGKEQTQDSSAAVTDRHLLETVSVSPTYRVHQSHC